MIRLVLYLLTIAAAAWGLSWIADRHGSLTVDWLGYNVQTSVFVAAIVLILSFITLALLFWIGVLTWTAPKRFARRLKRRRERIGQEAVRRGIFAAGAGDKLAALKAGAVAKKNAPEEPLTLLLEAQSAQLNDDAIASRQAFERMLEKPEMAELGLRGLFVEAKKAGQGEAAKQFAERALAANPALSWPTSSLFEMHCREGDWRGALRILGIAKQQKHIARREGDRRRALLLTQLATDLEDTEQGKALAYAQEALGLSPALTPAAAIAGRILASQGSAARATKILAEAWKTAPHPEIALIYAHARTGDSPRDRLARVKTLIASAPASIEGDIAVAVAAIEAKDWTTARSALEPHLTINPSARVCRLMARVEAGQNRDSGRVREWLGKAARGVPDPMWVAPDGTVSADWRAVAPTSGALGVFEWRTPSAKQVENTAGPLPEIDALDAGEPESCAAPQSSEVAETAELAPPKTSAQLPALTSELTHANAGSGAAENAGARTASELIAMNGSPNRTGHSKPDSAAPKPKIFTPGPAPDDPGPRDRESDDPGTPLSRFRRPK